MIVHIYGNPVDVDPILAIAKQHKLYIIEDFAETHGAAYIRPATGEHVRCGSIGDVSATSFYANKLISTGEGGMVLCKQPEHAERARSYRNLCFDTKRQFIHQEAAYNYRMSNLQAAVGMAQLELIDQTVATKRKNGEAYRDRLSQVQGLTFHPVPSYSYTVYWMYCILLDPKTGWDAIKFCEALNARGIGTRYFFWGMHRQPAFNNMGLFNGEEYPHTDFATKQGLYLPSGLTLTIQNIDEICNAVKDIIKTSPA